ncbi:hypothetical protein [Comamonas serinivorans]|uniref:hypothetical protein n=1 Tax=Comamonas serinivorans TaxID=1082851 RepID=UPI0012F83E4A|nr:hypothetical protein [Comamonas serinivorans]
MNRLILPVWMLGLLAACTTPRDIAPYGYACTHGLTFQARLYQDMVALDGARGHDLLPRLKDGSDGSFQFGNDRVTAVFGLGLDRRLATLRYADIPQAIHCERAQVQLGHAPVALSGGLAPALSPASASAGAGSALPPLAVSPVAGPKAKAPPEPPAPEDMQYTNIRFGGGPAPNSN